MKENSFRYKYERYLRDTPADADTKRKACVAVAAKIARVAHSLIKTGANYRPFFEVTGPSGSIRSARAAEACGSHLALNSLAFPRERRENLSLTSPDVPQLVRCRSQSTAASHASG